MRANQIRAGDRLARSDGWLEVLEVADFEVTVSLRIRISDLQPEGSWVAHDPNEELGVACGWFALCDRLATTRVEHPVLGAVPTCERCAARASE